MTETRHSHTKQAIDLFDVVIIGTGIGGLLCGNLLAIEGYRVCVLEKNKQIGGCLQTFVRDKIVFDSAVHYIGGLEKGQNLYQIFKYLGIMDQLKLEKMDEEGFDLILAGNDKKPYALAQGYENFIRVLSQDFPEETEAIQTYCDKMREICLKFPLYNLRRGDYDEKKSVLNIDAREYIESITRNETLRAVLAGNNILYAGKGRETPFYIHALILNSYIESSWRCIGGSSQIARLMARNIRNKAGIIITNAEVVSLVENQGQISHAILKGGNPVYGKEFISGLHPAQTLALTDSGTIRPAFRNRIRQLPNTVSGFMVNMILRKESIPYLKHNYYYHRPGRVWNMDEYEESEWPLGYGLFFSRQGQSEFAESATLLTYMKFGDTAKWEDSFNSSSAESERGNGYAEFKTQHAERLLDLLDENFPEIRKNTISYSCATPLSYRDYLGTADGSLYGIAKDYKDPVKTIIAPRTKLPNLYLTGQNLNLHGILGTAISGLITCASLMGNDDFIEKIKNA